MFGTLRVGLALLGAALPLQAFAQSAANLSALRGLVPVARLQATSSLRAVMWGCPVSTTLHFPDNVLLWLLSMESAWQRRV